MSKRCEISSEDRGLNFMSPVGYNETTHNQSHFPIDDDDIPLLFCSKFHMHSCLVEFSLERVIVKCLLLSFLLLNYGTSDLDLFRAGRTSCLDGSYKLFFSFLHASHKQQSKHFTICGNKFSTRFDGSLTKIQAITQQRKRHFLSERWATDPEERESHLQFLYNIIPVPPRDAQQAARGTLPPHMCVP